VVDDDIPFNRENLLATFRANDIDGRVFFWPLSRLPMFESKPENTVSHDLHQRAINLPSYHDITEQEMDRVIHHVHTYFKA
jgi:perosamine synthetase